MCYQDFAHYSCGHTGIHEETTCHLGADTPFYIKVACPNYEVSSRNLDERCGRGKFYCQEDEVGRFFDLVLQLQDEISTKFSILSNSEGEFHTLAAKFNHAANQAGIAENVRQQHPGYQSIQRNLTTLHQRRSQLLMERQVVEEVIKHGQHYLHIRAQADLKGQTLHPFPTFLPLDLIDKLPTTMKAQLSAMLPYDFVANTSMSGPPSNYNRGQYDPRATRGSSLRENVYNTTPVPFNLAQSFQKNLNTNAIHQGAGNPQTVDVGDKPSTTQKKTRPKRGKQPASSAKRSKLLSESPEPRRSARVRGQKVNYAESEASTVRSPSASPAKSDVDNFVPPAESEGNNSPSAISDASFSPERSTRGRRQNTSLRKAVSSPSNQVGNNSSLSSTVADWKRRNAPPAMIPNQQHTQWPSNQYSPMQPPISTEISTNPSMQPERASLSEVLRRAEMARSATEQSVMPLQNSTIPSQYGFAVPAIVANAFGSTRNAQGFSNSNSRGFMHRSSGANSTSGVMPPLNDVRQVYQLKQPPPQSQSYQVLSSSTPSSLSLAEFGLSSSPAGSHHATSVPMSRADSAISLPKPQRHSIPTHAALSNDIYARLQRGFDATAELTPPASHQAGRANTDPKKRSLPASSPLLQPNKRPRLSLPGEGLEGTRGGGQPSSFGGSMSSSSKMASHQLNQGSDASGVEVSDLPTTPAPVLTPTAVMYVPSNHSGVSNQPAGGIGVSDAVDLVDKNEHEFSDIDWSLINEDF